MRKAKDTVQEITREKILEASMGKEFKEAFENPPNVFTAEGITFKRVSLGRTDFDYDSDSGMETSHVYQAGEFFIVLSGTYWSYSGLKFDLWYFAKPVEVIQTKYVKV